MVQEICGLRECTGIEGVDLGILSRAITGMC